MSSRQREKYLEIIDRLEIELRAYIRTMRKANKWRGSDLGPSEYSLIFDTETTTDASQTLKFGVYQVRKGEALWEAGFFVNPDILRAREIALIRTYAAEINYRCVTVSEFIENVIFRVGYDLRALIIGFNLPFDISRLAIHHGPSRGRIMKGEFSHQLSPHRYWPNIQIKHLSSRVSLTRFTSRPGRIAGRGMRRRKVKLPPQPGYFLDVRTFAAALTSRSFTLGSLADFLGTETRKIDTEEHGKALTRNYLAYAKQDVQATWECFCALRQKFAEHNFTHTLPHKIFSEASIGKAYFREMFIRAWRELQPEFPDLLTGIILSTYFGGRSEVHHRRIVSQVIYCDFLSMYPTVCSLMGLWRFVIANGLKWRETRDETEALLRSVTLSDLQDPRFWPKLTTLVQISPDDDALPVRANYGGDQQSTIGLNILTAGNPSLQYTLADCIASKLLTGKAPKIERAITFVPDGVQTGLTPVNICGNPEYRIDPYTDDFYRRVIDLRTATKSRKKSAPASEQAALDSAQLTLKILANSMSYGNFVELNVERLSKPEARECYGHTGVPFTVTTDKIEEPGRYFHPLIGTLITGAARLMLAITERLVLDSGPDWAFCDTDSMAIAKPANMDGKEFQKRVEKVRSWFDALNPYAEKAQILKLEDVNFGLSAGKLTKKIEPLYCWAISAKRYALFNITSDGQIVIRKASAHGLGHFLTPYTAAEAPKSIPAPTAPLDEIGIERWQYDFWHQIIRAALDGHPDQVDLDYHPALDLPAASRYVATTPSLLRWFNKHNDNKSYGDQVRPNNFLLVYQIDPTALHHCYEYLADSVGSSSARAKPIALPRPVAPYDTYLTRAASQCFDRDTGIAIPANALKTYKSAIAQYPLRPERKFLDGDYRDRGITKRRRVCAMSVRYIGKESNRWEEQFYTGADEDAVIDYGRGVPEPKPLFDAMRQQIAMIGQRKVARGSGVARRTIERLMNGKQVREATIRKICRFLDR